MRLWIKLVVFLLLLVSLALTLFGLGKFTDTNDEKVVQVWGWQYSPYSADPIEYDDIVHHIAFTSVLGTLVTNYKVGSITPQLAESWSHSSDYMSWTFKIKDHCYFENGDLITPQIVANSFKRISLVQKKKKSRSGITEHLVGQNTFHSLADEILGISYDQQSIHFKFTVPKKDLLSIISFGIYSITHPSQYDLDGNWNDPKKVISSGPYKTESWENEKLTLLLNERQKLCFQMHPKPFSKIEIAFGNKNINPEKQEIISGSSKSLMIDDSFDFLGPADSDILYIRMYNTQSKASKLSELKIRQVLRDIITYEFERLKNINFPMSRSFFPLTLKGINPGQQRNPNGSDYQILNSLTLKVPKYLPSPKSERHKGILSFTEAFQTVMKVLEVKYGVDLQEVDLDLTNFLNPEKRAQLYDLELLLTNIAVENPYEDIQFMFESKEGIRLPDINEEIKPLLTNIKENLTEINNKLWDQACVIPITHYSSGLWVKKGLVDTTRLNSTLPATNFQFIGFR